MIRRRQTQLGSCTGLGYNEYRHIQGESDMECEYTTVICKEGLGGYFNKA